jgi:hypothetical protein
VKAVQRETLADLRAATILAQPAALDSALNRMRRLPEISSNRYLEPGFVGQFLLPTGEILSSPRISLSYLEKLSQDSLAGLRCVAGAALIFQYTRQPITVPQPLIRLISDPRREVRQTLVLAVFKDAGTAPDRIESLGRSLLSQLDSLPQNETARARMYSTILLLLASLAESHPAWLLNLAEETHTSTDPEIRAALVELLDSLGNAGRVQEVLGLLVVWAKMNEPNDWVICRSLTSAWAAQFSDESTQILDQLEKRIGLTSSITNARRALARKTSG